MSRIVGLYSTENTGARVEYLDAMLAASKSSARWALLKQAYQNVGLGWCGWRSPNMVVNGRVLVAVDGHIYNRSQIGSFESDAEVVTMLYEQYGFVETLSKLNGDFALALYDMPKNELWIARDRFGVKPLYYVSTPSLFAFASRLRALLRLPTVPNEPNRTFVALFAATHYRYFDNDPNASPYAHIAQLPAGMAICLKNDRATKSVYWSLKDQPDFTEPETTLACRYRDLLLDSVSLRMSAAEHPAFTLSGGMDSSSVLGGAVHLTNKKQEAFSVVYSDPTYDESGEIQSMVGKCVEPWHPIQVNTPDIFSIVSEMIDVHDEPIATATWLAHYLLCKNASASGIGSLFGGLGGDELNAGEYEHFLYFFADLKSEGQEAALTNEVKMWIQYHEHPIFHKSLDIVQDAFVRLVDLNSRGRCRPDYRRLLRYQKALNVEYFEFGGFTPAMDHPFKSYLKNRTYQDLFRETIPCCLRAEDRQTMAFGLDHVLPFLDHRLVEFMFRIRSSLKIRHGVTKHLLRQAMKGILPDETRNRIKKTGWNAPAHLWFSGRGKATLLDMIHSQAFRQRGIYNLAEVDRIIEEHNQIVSSGLNKENHMMFLWQMVNLEIWLQKNNRRSAAGPVQHV